MEVDMETMEQSRQKNMVIVILVVVILVLAGVAGYYYLNSRDEERAGSDSNLVPTVSPTISQSTDSAKPSELSSEPISTERAGEIATNEYGGTVKEVESDHFQNREAWEVELRDSREGRIEVKVDKYTGEILEVERQ